MRVVYAWEYRSNVPDATHFLDKVPSRENIFGSNALADAPHLLDWGCFLSDANLKNKTRRNKQMSKLIIAKTKNCVILTIRQLRLWDPDSQTVNKKKMKIRACFHNVQTMYVRTQLRK